MLLPDSQASQQTREDAFIALLPPEKGNQHRAVIAPPRVVYGGVPAIEADGLTMRFGDFTAVDHVTVEIDRGEIFGFLGSNGCGKTTTMKMPQFSPLAIPFFIIMNMLSGSTSPFDGMPLTLQYLMQAAP